MKPAPNDSKGGRRPYEPTQREIRRECEQIQAGWSPRERKKRSGQPTQTCWTPPHINWSTVTDAVAENQSDRPAVNCRSDVA